MAKEETKRITIKELLAIIKQLIQENRKYAIENAELRRMVGTDYLSGLLNRKALSNKEEVLESEILVMMDLDGFKNVNDTYGHPFGDKVIKIMGEVIQENIFHSDLAYRYGGDEFLIIFRNCPYEKAVSKAEKIARIFQLTCEKRLKVGVTTSLGIYCSEKIIPTIEAIEVADKALYSQKKKKKGTLVKESAV